ncbi:hypothetical protein TSAR_007046 [Trichomalopsis sarcophagae]|uniref:CHK kinase-like domain-containing protein n=1 Tax=Trichomalopsis sarcophagae TaxID=543379 RepID=A0A232F9S5_9HYME|nr:hypothetical protein TSAR_007046 [Trichomalopsis sarcophagae]
MTRTLITQAEALSLARQASGQSAKLVHYNWRLYSDDQIGYLGSHWQLVVEAESNGKARKHRFFVKAFPETPTEFQYVKGRGVFYQETVFFQNVIPELTKGVDVESWSPKCYLANGEVLGKKMSEEAMKQFSRIINNHKHEVLEDLGEKNYSMSPRLFNEEITRSAIKTLARFHASSILTEARLGKSLYELYPDAFREMGFAGVGKNQDWVMAGKDTAVRFTTCLPESLRRRGSRYKCSLSCERTKPTDKTMVACHGDLWPNNIMLDDSEPPRCKLVDFQFARYAPPAQDLVLLLHLSTSSEFRAKFEPEMVRDTVEKNNPSIEVPMSIEELREEILEQKLRAVLTAALYFPAVFANGKFAEDLIADPDEFEKFQYVDRREKVFELMRRNQMYRSRIEDAVRELVDYGERFFMIH